MSTSWTAQDLEILEKAIALGATKVKYSSDKEVEYRSLEEMLKVRDLIFKALNTTAKNNRVIYTEYNR